MNRFAFPAAALAATLAALAAAPMPLPAFAAGGLARCQAPDGTIGYTDKGCAVLGAKPVPVPGELMTRIVREQARATDGSGSLQAGFAGTTPMAATGMSAQATPGRRSPASGCARTPVQLAMDLHGALALGDVNRVAESYHFAGMAADAGERTLDRLRQLVGRPVLDSNYYAASIGDGATLLAGPGDGNAGMLQLVLGSADGGVAAIDFDVRRYAGCYFVSF